MLRRIPGLRDIPIKWKLVVVIVVVSTITAGAEMGMLMLHDTASFRKAIASRAKTTAEIASLNCIPALKFGDRADAAEVLSSLSAAPTIRAAYLLSDAGALIAEYVRSGENLSVPVLESLDPFSRFDAHNHALLHPISFNGRSVGAIYMLTDLSALQQHRHALLVFGSLTGLACFAGSVLLAMAVQLIFTGPIRTLRDSIERIMRQKDFSVRAPNPGKDEFGELVERFNSMLAEIEDRDRQLARNVVQLEESNRELDKRVAERTNELESTNKELESFSYSVSHDLRAPLRSVQGFSQILMKEHAQNLDSEVLRLLNIISTDVAKMGCLIDDLLAFSRMSRQKMSFSKIDMTELVRSVFEDLRRNAPARNVQLELGPLPAANGDRVMLRQVFINLLSNALKFTATRPTARISVAGESTSEIVKYEIRDNGVGFDKRYKDKLFGVFQRLHSEEEFEGTGVGLAIVQRVIQRHGGHVQADSEIEHGATFQIFLPNSIGAH